MDRSKTLQELAALARIARAPAAALEPADDDPLEGFEPVCLDCGYHLEGLADGRCPECGLGFSHGHLRDVERDRRIRARQLLSHTRHLPPLLGLIPFLIGAAFEGYLGFALETVGLLGGAGAWWFLNRTFLSYRSHFLLVLLIPLLPMFFWIASAPRGAYGMGACVAMAAGVAFLALRSSPLISSIALSVGVLTPMLLGGITLVRENRRLRAQGLWWSTLDVPAIPHWRALNPPQAIEAGVWLLALTAIFTIAMLLVARRAARRVRRARDARNL